MDACIDHSHANHASSGRYREMFTKRPKSGSAVPLPILIAAIAILAAAGAAIAQESTWIVTDGNWSTSANWDPPNVPDSPGESALVPDGGGAYAITLDLNPTADRIRILNPGATLRLGSRTVHCVGAEGLVNHGILLADGNARMYGHIDNMPAGRFIIQTGYDVSLYSTTLHNDGVILLNEQGVGNAAIDILEMLTLSGAGEMELNGDNVNTRIYAYHGHTLTQGADHTIRGAGGIEAPLANLGTVDADRPGGTLFLHGFNKSNEGLLRASNSGLLRIQNFTLDNSGGTILAGGGDVQLENN